ncbi:sigma factor G inhibitor Gin [uncultured Clostridium sp.]|jgi:hypothetical protein|uniref:sigma factor G inhibitor Gin n=1 Tax=uncultured Clostridium sp. TaxID=59620 RepID=UPI00262A52A8|nr:sigma factor G inhibitor Gin [uncultured Clostridium sp.]
MENNNLDEINEKVLDCDDIAEILNLDKENVIEIKSEIDIVENNKVIISEYKSYDEKQVLDMICIICGKTKCRGIVIMDKKICLDCEEKAVKADIRSEFYTDYKEKIFRSVVGKLKNLG